MLYCMTVSFCLFCVQVLVANDATFQDVSTEIVRVYQGISSASADDG